MRKYSVLMILILFLSWGCKKDFVVEDISKEKVTVNAPANNSSTTINMVTFWWNELDGAEEYNLQLVRPDFANAVQLILDTNVVSTKFNFSLKPGSYQWRIKAFNAGHSTAYQTYNLKIDTTSDLSEQFVNLLSPVTGAVTGNTLVTFSWSSIKVAKKYQFQIDGGLILDTVLEAKTSLTYPLPAAKNFTTAYTWRVKAINDLSESQYNTPEFKLIVDRKGPQTPVLSFPVHGNSVTGADSLKWIHGPDTKYDSIYVADDSLFVSMLVQMRVDGTSINPSEFSIPPNPVGTYYWWKVRSFDVFGNPSAYAFRRKFILAP